MNQVGLGGDGAVLIALSDWQVGFSGAVEKAGKWLRAREKLVVRRTAGMNRPLIPLDEARVAVSFSVEQVSGAGFDFEAAEAQEFFGRIFDGDAAAGLMCFALVGEGVFIFRGHDEVVERQLTGEEADVFHCRKPEIVGGIVIDGSDGFAVYDADSGGLVDGHDGFVRWGRRRRFGLGWFLGGLRVSRLEGFEGAVEIAVGSGFQVVVEFDLAMSAGVPVAAGEAGGV